MSVSELGSSLVTPYDPRRRAPDRGAHRDSPPNLTPEAAAAPSALAPHPGFGPVFLPDLSQLAALGETWPVSERPALPPADVGIFAHLKKLVAAIREGDLALARAVVHALETEMLVERSAGRSSRSLDDDAPSARRPSPSHVDSAYETLANYLATDGLTT
jgi:hypothetical protein